MRGDWRNQNEKMDYTMINAVSQCPISNLASTTPGLECNNTNKLHSKSYQVDCPSDFSHKYITSNIVSMFLNHHSLLGPQLYLHWRK